MRRGIIEQQARDRDRSKSALSQTADDRGQCGDRLRAIAAGVVLIFRRSSNATVMLDEQLQRGLVGLEHALLIGRTARLADISRASQKHQLRLV